MSDVTRILTAIEQGNAKATDQLLCSVAACLDKRNFPRRRRYCFPAMPE